MPCVGEYPLLRCSIASMAARRIGSGTSKSGWPIERLMGSFSRAARSNTLRMPELSNCDMRSASNGRGMGLGELFEHFQCLAGALDAAQAVGQLLGLHQRREQLGAAAVAGGAAARGRFLAGGPASAA